MSAVVHKTKVVSAQEIFPLTISDVQTSCLFVHRTVAVCVSSIAYLRKIFGDNQFQKRTWEGCEIPILNGKGDRAKRLISYIKGVYDALRKGYLRKMVLGLTCNKENSNEVVEMYIFNFSYKENGAPVVEIGGKNNVASFQNVSITDSRADVVRLMRQTAYFAQTLENVPENTHFVIKLWYYDDRTPKEYEPSQFVPTSPEDFNFFDGQREIALILGSVGTSFHRCQVGVRSVLGGNVDDDLLAVEPIPILKNTAYNKLPEKDITSSSIDFKRKKVQRDKKIESDDEDLQIDAIIKRPKILRRVSNEKENHRR